MNYYDLLEIQPTASEEVIKMAYKALVKKYHPDIYEGDKQDANEMLQKINAAYEILSDEDKRAKYDQEIGVNQDQYRKSEKQQKDTKQTNDLTVNKDDTGLNSSYKGHGREKKNFISSVFSFVITVLLVYVIIGIITGNLRSWNEKIVHYSKVVIHMAKNINLKKYEKGSAEEFINQYIESIFDGDEYSALKKISPDNEKLKEMTIEASKFFRQYKDDKMIGFMLRDMTYADVDIEPFGKDHQYRIIFETCDYEKIVKQMEPYESEAYIAKKIKEQVSSAPKNLKKEIVITLSNEDGAWCITDMPEREFVNAFTGNLLDTFLDGNLQ